MFARQPSLSGQQLNLQVRLRDQASRSHLIVVKSITLKGHPKSTLKGTRIKPRKDPDVAYFVDVMTPQVRGSVKDKPPDHKYVVYYRFNPSFLYITSFVKYS